MSWLPAELLLLLACGAGPRPAEPERSESPDGGFLDVQVDDPQFGDHFLVGGNGLIVEPIEGGLITSGFEWHGPVTRVHDLEEEAARVGTATQYAEIVWGEGGFASSPAEYVHLFSAEDWDEPVLEFYDDYWPNLLTAGDLTGDGVEDVAYADYSFYDPGHTGMVAVIDGSERGEASWPVAVFGSTTVAFGWDPEVLGDLNGDGMADLSIEGRHEGRSYAFIYFGPTTQYYDVTAADAVSYLGVSGILPVGDVDGDGLDDVLNVSHDRAWVQSISGRGHFDEDDYVIDMVCDDVMLSRIMVPGTRLGDLPSVAETFYSGGFLIDPPSADEWDCADRIVAPWPADTFLYAAAATDLDQSGAPELALGLTLGTTTGVVIWEDAFEGW